MKLGGLSLRWVIVIPFAMITALSGVAVAGIFWQGKQRDIALVVDELEAMLNQRIQERLTEFLENPNAMNRINAELVRKGILKTQDPNSEIFLQQQLRGVADLSWVYYGAAADGSFVAATRLTEDQTIQTFISDQTTNFIGTYLDENRQIIRQTRPYDARNRPWFQSAIQQQQAVWTDIYASFNTGDLLITAAMPVYDSQQQLLGVVATDYSLEGISQFLQRLKVGRTGIVLIADTAGNLVADSTGTPIFHLDDQTLSRERLVNSRDPLRREVGQLLLNHIAHSGGFNPTLKQRLEIEQTRYFLRMERYRDQQNLVWWIITLIPETDFLAPLQENLRTTFLLSSAGVLAAVILGSVLAAAIVIPVRRLGLVSQSLAAGQWQQTLPPTFGILELRSLSGSFAQMSQQLQNSYQELQAINAELEKRVVERTQALQNQEALFRGVFENAPVGIVLDRISGEFVMANPAMEKILGYSLAELQHVTYRDYTHPEDLAIEDQLWQELINGSREFYTLEKRCRHHSGQELWIAADVSLICDQAGIPQFSLAILQDITSLKEAELEKEKARQSAEAANRAKSTFLANMSHELRTPLNAIIGFSQLLNRDPQLSEKQRQTLGTILRSGEHLLGLINDVLDMAKIEAGKIVLQPVTFDLFAMLDTLQEMLSVRAEAKNLYLRFDRDPQLPQWIITDERKLRQVLINIIGNGIKFTQTGGVEVVVRVVEAGDPVTLSFAIRDTGLGMTPEEVGMLFQAFVQTDTSKKVSEGTGLGLVISRQFARLMDGEISVSSQKGVGTTFTVRIRAGCASGCAAGVTEAPVTGLLPGQPTYRILVADDHKDNRELIDQLLTGVGFQVKQASNGQEALALSQAWLPDLVFMDKQMPVMDGWTASRLLKQQFPQVKVIALSASVFEQDREAWESVGCDAFIPKPFQENQLFQALEQHLGVRFSRSTVSFAPAAPKPSFVLSPETLAVMPRSWIEALHQAATTLSNRKLRQLVSAIPPEHQDLAQTLQTLVKKVQIDPILAVTTAILYPPDNS